MSIREEFNVGTADRVNFGVCIKPDDAYRIAAADAAVQRTLIQILSLTIDTLEGMGGDWEEYDVSEDYGDPRKINMPRADPLAAKLYQLYDMDGLPDVGNIMDHVQNVKFYFAHFWDREGNKAVGLSKTVRFKASLSSNGRLLQWKDNTLKVVDGGVLTLDRFFDAIITNNRVYMAKPRPVEQVADIVEEVAATAQTKIDEIQAAMPFLDLSLIRRDISKHPRLARLAASIAKRTDLGDIKQDKLIEVCEQHAILLRPLDGLLRPKRTNETALLEVLDDRRYSTQLTEAAAIPFRASGRQKVIRP